MTEGPITEQEAIDQIKAKWGLFGAEGVGPGPDDLFQRLEDGGHVNRTVVHRYLCRKGGCKLATVIKLGDDVIVRTKDYKLAPATNAATSVEIARQINTLDGDRHWPGETLLVQQLARSGDEANITMNCRHGLRKIRAVDILSTCQDVRPGHPGAPSRI